MLFDITDSPIRSIYFEVWVSCKMTRRDTKTASVPKFSPWSAVA